MKIVWLLVFYVGMCASCVLVASNADYSAFNETVFVQPTPWVQLQFPYNQIPTLNLTPTGPTGSVIALTGGSGSITGGAGFTGVTGGGTGTNSMLQLSTSGGTGTTFATIASSLIASYDPGRGSNTIFSAVFNTGVANNFQIIGIGNAQDGFFFGYNGTAFGILHRRASIDTWVAQTSWNGDQVNGTGLSGFVLNPQTGNVYKIQYQWLGFGVIKFYVQRSVDGVWVLVHTIQYPNSNTIPSLRNGSLQTYASVYNNATGTASLVTLKTAAMSAFTESNINPSLCPRFSVQSISKTFAAGTQRVGLAIRNKSTFQNVNNQTSVYPTYFSALQTTTTAGRRIVFSLFLNPTVALTYADVNTNLSTVEFVSPGTNIIPTGGFLIATFNVSTTNQVTQVDISDMGIVLRPGDSLVCTGNALGGNTVARLSLSWYEG